MAYTISTTTKAPILDQDGAPIIEGATTVAFNPTGVAGLAAVAGVLYLTGITPGVTQVTITPVGATEGAVHAVTVEGVPFDWTLGAPVAK